MMARVPCSLEIPHCSHPRTNARVLKLLDGDVHPGTRLLDLGAGPGHFCARLSEHLVKRGVDPAGIITACDLHPEQFQPEGITCVRGDLGDRLPFEDGVFDLVLCQEVIEHLSNQQGAVEEIARVLAPGGRAIITTPNILNLNGRLRFLVDGTMPLFDILPIAETDVIHTSGHIAPISLYYLYYFARVAGFERIDFHIDRVKKSAAFVFPFFVLGSWFLRSAVNVRRRKHPAWAENAEAVAAMNSWRTLVGRTIILDARLP